MEDMHDIDTSTEEAFAAEVAAIAEAPDGARRLLALLREDNAVYRQRGASTVVRMRGWVLLALAHAGVDDSGLVYLLDELDNGSDPYLVGAAARALRSYAQPESAFAPYVLRAISNIGAHDAPLAFSEYGAYGDETCAVRELLATLVWLGGQKSLADIASLCRQYHQAPDDVAKLAQSRKPTSAHRTHGASSCCTATLDLSTLGVSARQRDGHGIGVDAVELEDHDGARSRFERYFRGKPSIVAFFYTRCDNPLKCSLTITKLGRVQRVLGEHGLSGRIRTAAITYDPQYDTPERLRNYARDRGMLLDEDNRAFRTMTDFGVLREHFQLGVNYVETLVNRHQVEVFVLNARGEIVTAFERLQWDEVTLLDRATALLKATEAAA